MNLSLLRQHRVVVATVGVLALGAAVWGGVSLSKGKKSTLPRELSAEAIKAAANDPGQIFEKVRQAMESGNLTEEQRHELRENVHEVMEAQMDKRLDEYFTAPASQKQAILDRHIDEMQARMKDWPQRREREGTDRRPATADGRPRPGGSAGTEAARGGGSGGSAPNSPGAGGDGRRHWGGPGGRTREQEKLRSESRDPDARARRMAYFTAMRQRAEQRGIQMPMMGGRGGPR
ncbi:MAG TPA: hypothetical protein VLM89_11020 [Phycisphaerae bacterium]|nr:hypothetical protein [Phycisphaerae bacterium]